MPRDKYRIHEVAKDFGMSSKEIIAILDKYSDEPKKHSTALDDKQLNVIFDTLTQNTEVASFDAYFAAGEKTKAEKEVKAPEKEEAPKAPAKKTTTRKTTTTKTTTTRKTTASKAKKTEE